MPERINKAKWKGNKEKVKQKEVKHKEKPLRRKHGQNKLIKRMESEINEVNKNE